MKKVRKKERKEGWKETEDVRKGGRKEKKEIENKRRQELNIK